MQAECHDADVVVVGGGTAGSATALLCARQGLRTVLLEARPLELAGARWVNALPPGVFARIGIEPSVAPEKVEEDLPVTLLGPEGRSGVTIDPSPVWHIDIRLLVDRLHGLAAAAGVRCFDRVTIGEPVLDKGRPVELPARQELDDGRTRDLSFKARLFVDASGLSGALRRRVPALAACCPDVPERHLCFAIQEVCTISDRAGAGAFLARHRATPGQAVARNGLHGGFSTMGVLVGQNLERVGLLVGALADGTHGRTSDHLKEFKQREGWIGERLFGGGGLIPLRRPYDRLAVRGAALVGDAACMVFSAHGSGIAAGMTAGRMLAEAASAGGDPGAIRNLWKYQSHFHRTLGPALSSYDHVRRLVQSIDGGDIDGLISSGMLRSGALRAALLQEMYKPGPGDVPGTVRLGLHAPNLLRKAAAYGGLIGATLALYPLYPTKPDDAGLRRWSHAIAALYGDPPDIA